jgi:hypothetical protein
MKRIGELLTGFFDEGTLKKAEGYSNLFSSWRSIAGDGIADHSRIVELERSVLLVEADHPGWIQILQIKQKMLLQTVQRQFPDLTVTAIAFRLSRGGVPEPGRAAPPVELPASGAGTPEPPVPASPEGDPYGGIAEGEFRETLKRLERGLKKPSRRGTQS